MWWLPRVSDGADREESELPQQIAARPANIATALARHRSLSLFLIQAALSVSQRGSLIERIGGFYVRYYYCEKSIKHIFSTPPHKHTSTTTGTLNRRTKWLKPTRQTSKQVIILVFLKMNFFLLLTLIQWTMGQVLYEESVKATLEDALTERRGTQAPKMPLPEYANLNCANKVFPEDKWMEDERGLRKTELTLKVCVWINY